MSEQGRRQAFALAVVMVGAVFVALVALGGGPEEPATTSTSESVEADAPPPTEAAAGGEPVVLGAEGGNEGREPERPERPEPERDETRRLPHATETDVSDAEDLQPGERPPHDVDALLPAALAQAREFMGPFLRYEAEGASPAVRRDLERLASDSLAARILSQDPRTPDGVSEPAGARLVGVEGEVTGAGEAVVVATIAYGPERSGLPLNLELEESGWLVTDLG
jgi:hypothetical protein